MNAATAPGNARPADGSSTVGLATGRCEPTGEQSFKACMRMVPGAVCIVAAANGEERNGLTATSWCALSSDPPQLLVCVNRDASAHDAILGAGCFSINQLSSSQVDVAATFAGQDRLSGEARFGIGAWSKLATGAPVLDDAVAVLDCRLEEIHEGLTHTILIGRCIAMRRQAEAEPLIYLNQSFHRSAPLDTKNS